MSRHPAADWTYSEYASLPDDGQKYEVIDGEVCVTPAPSLTHQEIAGRLYRALISYVEEHKLGRVLWDVDLLFVSGQFLRPDLVYVSAERSHGLSDRGVEVAPDLVIEVLSPQSRQIDRVKKPPRYREFGVREYWVVDPVAHAVEVYALARGITTPETFADVLVFEPAPDVPSLRIEIARLFAGL
jgi:Uma2 family endonuclease